MSAIIDFFRTALFVHPPHPMLVHFPIGLTGGAAFFILLALWKRSDRLEKVAFANICLATVSVLAASLLGIRDNIFFYKGNASNHILKITLATILLVVTAATSIYRWRNPDVFERKSGKVIYSAAYFLSFGLAIALGYLGGIIVFGP